MRRRWHEHQLVPRRRPGPRSPQGFNGRLFPAAPPGPRPSPGNGSVMTCPRLFDLTGKVAIVTGSSRGIGLAIAAAMAEHGAKVVISSRKQEACDEVALAINNQHGGGRAIAVAANISEKLALQQLVDETR